MSGFFSHKKMEPKKLGLHGVPQHAALTQLQEKTGYRLVQENGQRKFGGPPPGWEGPAPCRGCEIFIGKIPRDIYEDELVPVFQSMGRIYEFRLMMDFSGSNRGYAFCTYCQRGDAKRAVKELNNFEIRKRRFLGVCLSVDNCRLFVGGIPKTKVKDEILAEMCKVTEGVVDVIVYPSAMDKSRNRGFAFVEYQSHRAAAMARRKLIPGRIQLWGHNIAVDWAEPEPETDEDIMATVRILYVRNLMLSTSEEHLKEIFEGIVLKKDCIERVKKLRDYAFIHFRQREDAIKAMEKMNGCQIDGSTVEVVLAKPVDKNEYNVRMAKAKGLSQIINGNEMETNLTPTQNQWISQCPRGVNKVAVPVKSRGRGAAGSRSAGGTKNYYSAVTRQHPVETLDSICQKNHWGSPTYDLFSAVQPDSTTGAECQFFLYKVTIPALFPLAFQPAKLCRTPEEAKVYAAEHCLSQLGIPVESSEITVRPGLTTVYPGRPVPPSVPIPRDVQVSISSTAPSYVMGNIIRNAEYPSASFEYHPAVFTQYP